MSIASNFLLVKLLLSLSFEFKDFSFFYETRKPSILYCLPIAGSRRDGFMPFPRTLSKIWNTTILVNDFNLAYWVHFFLFSFFQQLNLNHHHHVVLVARISLTLSRHFSLSFIASGRSSGQHPVSSHSCWMYVRAGRPAFAWPCVGIHKST